MTLIMDRNAHIAAYCVSGKYSDLTMEKKLRPYQANVTDSRED